MVDSVGSSPSRVYVPPVEPQTTAPPEALAAETSTQVAAPAKPMATSSGQVAVSDASLQGTDWNELVDSMGAMNVSVSVTAIMSMLIEIMAQMRQDARQAAFDDMQTALDQNLAAVEKLKDAAKTEMITGIAVGVTSIVGTGVSYGMASKGGKLTEGAANLDPNSTQFKLQTAQAQNFTTKAHIGGQMTSSVGQMGSSIGQSIADQKKADAKALEAEAQYSESLSQQERDFMKELNDTISAALATMKAVNQAQHEATGQIWGA